MGMSGPARAPVLSFFSLALMAQKPWQQITVPPHDAGLLLARAPGPHQVRRGRGSQTRQGGFAGGKISKEYPQLSMQGLAADIRIRVAPEGRARQPYGWEAISLGIREATSSCHRKG